MVEEKEEEEEEVLIASAKGRYGPKPLHPKKVMYGMPLV